MDVISESAMYLVGVYYFATKFKWHGLFFFQACIFIFSCCLFLVAVYL